ncbi:MAG: NAD(P)H-hydrate dehydratase [Candidatus Aenigmarchaeota archaeon]|nr:NAD(P)H-hydrate dehydratase [Candidatus Aenigmarchaeota archaeon]
MNPAQKPQIVSKEILKKIYLPRPEWSHKGNFGHVLIIGGSRKYSGSPAFAAFAAFRSGSDLVTIAAPERAANTIASFSPDMITEPLKGDYLNNSHLKPILEIAKNADAIVIGGGIERKQETASLVQNLLKSVRIPCVIDADAVHAVSLNPEILSGKPFVLTPHQREFQSLTREDPTNEISHRTDVVKFFAARLKTTILLKGHTDIISDGERVSHNTTGNPNMTKGGTGDTLAGICGAVLGMKFDPFTAACAAAYINGAAGDLAAKEKGPGLMASDLLDKIALIIK